MDSSLSDEQASSHISAYEVERNSHKKALHDVVQKDLLAAGFTDAAALRFVFPGEGGSTLQEDVVRSDAPL